ncbi:hypothetical protein J1766_gp56 [Gordonia phage Bizzy]|uniref:Uncharacterized protein n=1 Tax=Gordonia phage Bizzy TaxID=2483667 RepID=A0A3G3M842_9CAUD|nr:hypothetical protein J1766_gp56 [Gordonia phage Bizzy]AYR02692.1 hypothetical protein SEA_BIZZY_56 [Gordonia phage Bizzy]
MNNQPDRHKPDMDTPRTPRDIAQLLTATIREGARGGDLAAVGAAATAAAILDLADAIRETRTDDEPDNTPTPPEKLLCLAEGHTPRGNRVVCAEPAGHPQQHVAGGYQWWDDGRPATSTLPPGYTPTMPDVVVDLPVVCGWSWAEPFGGGHHDCGLVEGHGGDHRCGGCGVTTEVDDDDADAGPPAPRCPAEGCGRVDGHDGVHLADEPLTMPTLTVKRGGIRYHHTDEGGDTSALADVPDGSHEHGRAPAPEPVSSPVQPPNGDADPLWRLRLLVGRTRRAVGVEPLPPSRYTLGALVDDLDERVRQLVKSRDNWADAADKPPAPDGVVDSPVVCGHAWPNYVDGDHEHVCAQPDDDGHVWHVCDTCLKITPEVRDGHAVAGQWLVVRTGPNPAAFGAFRTADDAHTWAAEHPDTVGTTLPTILPIIGPAL